MRREIRRFLQVAWVLLIHFGLGVGLGYASILGWPNAILLGLILAGVMALTLTMLVATDSADRGFPIACLLYIAPVTLTAILIIQVLVRLVLTWLGSAPPRF